VEAHFLKLPRPGELRSIGSLVEEGESKRARQEVVDRGLITKQ